MKNRIDRFFLVLFFFITLIAPSWAARSASIEVKITIVGGDLSLETSDIQFTPVHLRGNGHAVSEASNVIGVTDPTGTGAGWNITARATDLVSDNGDNRLPLKNIDFRVKNITPNLISSLSQVPIDGIRGSGRQVTLSYVDQKILTASKGAGMGKYQITPRYQMKVPARTPTGDYSSKVTFTIFAGP